MRRSLARFGPLAVAATLSLRLFLVWQSQYIPPHFYCDSTSHLLVGLLTFEGILPWSWRFFPLPATLYAIGIKFGLDILYAPLIINGGLAAITLCCLYEGTRELADALAASLAAILVISLPAFTRLAFSGDQEMTALALSSMAFWCACRGASHPEKSKFAWHMAAIGCLGTALFARSESAGLLFFCTLAAAISWRKRPVYAACIIGWAAFWMFLRAPSALAHLHGAQHDNAEQLNSMDLFQRIGMLPRSLAGDWPLNVLLLFGFGIFFTTPGAPLVVFLFCVILVQALLLWISSFSFGASMGEPERNLCFILTGLAIPAAIVVNAGMSRLTRRSAWTAAILVIVLLSASWTMSIGERPRITKPIEQERLLGWKLRQLAAHGSLGKPGSLVLFEAVDQDWPNVVVFSGLQDRFRIVSTENLGWGSSYVWNGSEPVGIAVIRSESTLRRLKKEMRVGKLVAEDGPFKIFETGTL